MGALSSHSLWDQSMKCLLSKALRFSQVHGNSVQWWSGSIPGPSAAITELWAGEIIQLPYWKTWSLGPLQHQQLREV